MKKLHITADTPLSALFHDGCHEVLRGAINDWRSNLKGDNPTVDTLQISYFEFDFSKPQFGPCDVYKDLAWMVIECPLIVPISVLVRYMVSHSNLQAKSSSIYRMINNYIEQYQ
mgnify:FL=1|jgi:hypothetical protein